MSADFRSVHTALWRTDDWFQALETDARLFWIYLFTNPSASAAGIYRLTVRTMAFESGLAEKRVRELLAQFERDGKAYYENGIVWVRKMREYQAPGKLSPKMAAHYAAELAKIPDCRLKREYMIGYRYPIDTLSIPVQPMPDRVSIPDRTDTDTDTVCVTDDALQDEPQPKGNTHTPPPFGFMERTDDQKAVLRQFQDITAQVITGSEKRVSWLDDMTASAGKVRMMALLSDMQAEIQAGRLIPYNALKWLSDSLRTAPGKNGKHAPSIDDMPDFGSTPT